MQPSPKGTERWSQTLPAAQGGAGGLARGPAHLRHDRASMAMVRTGETRLPIGSALMIACRDSRAVPPGVPPRPGQGLGRQMAGDRISYDGVQYHRRFHSFHGQLAFDVLGEAAQWCPTLCNSMDYTVLGILQARILEWVAFPFTRGSSQPRDRTQVSYIASGFITS